MSVDSKKTLEQISSGIQFSCVYFPGLSWQGCSQSDGGLDNQYSLDMKLFMVVVKQFKPICYRNTGDTSRRGGIFPKYPFLAGISNSIASDGILVLTRSLRWIKTPSFAS
ncbi:hypothetical protein PMIT1320_01638 [Prochlorococcus marinus str. MIT 1320]|nr:hypothetical protein PMIT1320_01638 [Prochlorococcus marinus str. MIT 1320]